MEKLFQDTFESIMQMSKEEFYGSMKSMKLDSRLEEYNPWREAVLDALALTGHTLPETATPEEIIKFVIQQEVKNATNRS